MLELVGFDGDDTLWHSQGYYDAAQAEFERIVGRYVDLGDARLHERLLAIESRNVHHISHSAKQQMRSKQWNNGVERYCKMCLFYTPRYG